MGVREYSALRPVGLAAAVLVACHAAGAGAETPSHRFEIDGVAYRHDGAGVFRPVTEPGSAPAPVIDLKAVEHGYESGTDPDVPVFTDITLPGITPPLIDTEGRNYALITLYNIDPPLEDLPSAEPGIDRGMDYRDPSNIVKGVYSNHVSPVLTNDREEARVAGHPIGHFYVRVEVPGYPPVLTGMTTIARADAELVDLTLKRQLGLGGVLLTHQPGRLYSSGEVLRELSLRQRELRVIDGRHYRKEGGRNVGPTYVIEDGNVVFLQVRVPLANGEDAIGVFLEYLARGQQRRFGSLLSRPGRGSGAGCSAFAMHWLKAAGVIPFVDEAAMAGHARTEPFGPAFWASFYRELTIPWAHVGCDERNGLPGRAQAADYTFFDLLFHDLETEEIVSATEGVSALIQDDFGVVAGTLFQYGVLTPVRGLFINAWRKDPRDRGAYAWAAPGEGLSFGFWDNASFSDWVKAAWAAERLPDGFARMREGRFLGVAVDAMAAPRQAEPFYAAADRLARLRAQQAVAGAAPRNCRELFENFPPD